MAQAAYIIMVQSLLDRAGLEIRPELKRALDDFKVFAEGFQRQIVKRAQRMPKSKQHTWLRSRAVIPHIARLDKQLELLASAGFNLKSIPKLEVCEAFLAAYKSS